MPSSGVSAATLETRVKVAPVQVLQLSGCTLAGIFAGNITTWNDALVQADNPGAASFPSAPITIVHLPNGFSATYALSSYLSM